MAMPRTIFEPEHEQFRDSARRFMQREISGNVARWRTQGCVDREAFLKMGARGFLVMWADEAHGGAGVRDLRFEQILQEENVRHGDVGFFQNAHSMIVAPYIDRFGTPAQQKKYLPGAVSGETILAIAMTEPDAGSDLAAIRTRADDKGDYWLLNGAKTFISNGILADLVVVAARTGAGERGRIGLFLVEASMPGFRRGRNLKKIGLHAQDTAELFFENIELPKENVLGDPARGFSYMAECLAVERLMSAITSIAHAQTAFDLTLDFVRERRAFGRPIGVFQNTRFRLAELRARLDSVQCYVDQCVMLGNADALSAEAACAAKMLTSDLENEVIDVCVQFHGGAGYMEEYRIARMYCDARISKIYAGANEIMKEVIARGMGLDERTLT